MDKKQVQEESWTLGTFIKSLKDKNIITDGECRELEKIKDSLNSDHHNYVQTNIEDTRNLASEMIDFLHE